MDDKIALFNGAGFVFATINYRLTDTTAIPVGPQYPVHNQDSADAVAWLVAHAAEFGIDPTRIAVLGHSAGGGITAAISTDEQFLGRNGLPLTTIRCAASMDGEGYDVVAGATFPDEFVSGSYQAAFGTDPAVWVEASPVGHVGPEKGIPRFFIAERGGDWRMAQHTAFISALQGAGVRTTVLDVSMLAHADLTTIIGRPDDTIVTPALMDYLGGCFSAVRRTGEDR
jgi:acetyl esterase/lipase